MFFMYSAHVSMAQIQNDSVAFYKIDSLNYQLFRHSLSLKNTLRIAPCEQLGVKPPIILVNETELGVLALEQPSKKIPINDITEPYTDNTIHVYWIHGLNGSVESLKIPAYASQHGTLDGTFPARKLVSVLGSNYTGTPQQPAYSEDYGITRAAQDWSTIASSLPAGNGTFPQHGPKDFIIAHSQGGIVAREWLRIMDEYPSQFPKHAHALVTFGTSHTGAQILNNTRPDLLNKAPNFFNEGCKALANAEVTAKIQQNFFTRLVVSNNMKNMLVNTGCGVFSNTIVPFALDNYHKRTTLDFYVGSPFLTQPSAYHPQGGLNDYTLKAATVQFYGEEEQPIMWRFFSSTLKLGTDALDNKQIEFGYDDDQQLPQKVNAMINEYQAKLITAEKNYNYWKNFKCALSFMGCDIPCLILCKNLKNKEVNNYKNEVSGYEKAIKWLSEANDYYLTDIVGARVSTTKLYCMEQAINYCKYQAWELINGNYVLVDKPPFITSINTNTYESTTNTCPQDYTQSSGTNCYREVKYTKVYKTTGYYKPNDGVVLAESAAAQLKSNPNYSKAYILLPKTNHDQMKNCKKTRDALTKLYDGELGASFIVTKK